MVFGKTLEDSNKFACLPLKESNAIFHLKHSCTVLDVLRSRSPMNVLGVLAGNHVRQLFNQRQYRISDNICVYSELFEAL